MKASDIERAAATQGGFLENFETPTAPAAQAEPTKRHKPHTKQQANENGRLSVTFWAYSELAQNVREVAKWENKSVNDIINRALKEYLQNWKPSKRTPPTLENMNNINV